MRSLAIIFLFCLPSLSYGQFWWYQPHISPQADRIDSIGKTRLKNSKARNFDQKTRRLSIRNDDERIHRRWAIKDEYHERQKTFTAMDRLKRKLDNAEQMAILREREKGLIKKGILRPKGNSEIIVNGNSYSNYEDFKGSEDRKLMIVNAIKREENYKRHEELEKQRYQELVWRSALRNPEFRARYVANQIREEVDDKVRNDPILRIERGEEVPFEEWPEHWKENWRKFTEKEYEKFTPRPSKSN